MISPPDRAPVCRRDTLNLTCTTSGRFQEWSFSLTPENATASIRYIRTLQLDGPNHLQTYEQMIGSTTFLYLRSSAENMLPLISTLSISLVSEDLNGIVVNCTDVTAGDTVSAIIINAMIGNIKFQVNYNYYGSILAF